MNFKTLYCWYLNTFMPSCCQRLPFSPHLQKNVSQLLKQKLAAQHLFVLSVNFLSGGKMAVKSFLSFITWEGVVIFQSMLDAKIIRNWSSIEYDK